MGGNFGTTNGATVLTVPANGSWMGQVALSAAITAAPGDIATTAQVTVVLHGVGADGWADGDTVAALAMALPPVAAGATAGTATSSSVCMPDVKIRTRDNPVTLTLTLPPRVTGNALAAGIFLF